MNGVGNRGQPLSKLHAVTEVTVPSPSAGFSRKVVAAVPQESSAADAKPRGLTLNGSDFIRRNPKLN